MASKGIIIFYTISVMLTNVMFAKTNLSLKQAFDKKHITATAICNGGLELNYTIHNVLKDSVYITIPAGWRFNSNDKQNDYQDILVTHDIILALKAKDTKTITVSGYCCEANKAGPYKGISYTVGKMADSNLVQLARYLNTHIVDKNTEQYSVWAISDKKETANITSPNDSIAALLRSFVANLKGEPLPWYTLLKKSGVSQSGFVTDHPIKFKTDIPYTITKVGYSYCYIVDQNGNKVSAVLGKWLLPENVTYNVSMNVAHLQKGTYSLVLEHSSEKIFEKEFKI